MKQLMARDKLESSSARPPELTGSGCSRRSCGTRKEECKGSASLITIANSVIALPLTTYRHARTHDADNRRSVAGV